MFIERYAKKIVLINEKTFPRWCQVLYYTVKSNFYDNIDKIAIEIFCTINTQCICDAVFLIHHFPLKTCLSSLHFYSWYSSVEHQLLRNINWIFFFFFSFCREKNLQSSAMYAVLEYVYVRGVSSENISDFWDNITLI